MLNENLVRLNLFVAQKLKILENVIKLLPLQQPSEALILTSILAEDVNFHMKYCLFVKIENWVALDYV